MTQAPLDRLVTGMAPASSVPAELVRELAFERARREQLEKQLVAALATANQQQLAFEESQRQLFSITDPLPVLVSYIDAQGRYRFVNQTYERWFGVARETILGRSVADVLGAEAYEQLSDLLEQARSGRRVNVQRRVSYRDGGERYVDITYIPHRHAAGDVQGFVALIWDISDSKRVELAREANALRSERLMRVTAAIADAVEPEQVLEAVVDRVADVLGASSVGLWLSSEDGQRLELVRAAGRPEALRALTSVGLDPGQAKQEATGPAAPLAAPLTAAVREHAPFWVSSRGELERLWPELAASFSAASPACLAWLPLGTRGTTRGALGLCFADERSHDPLERDFLLLVARYAGQAIERSKLLETERALRAQSEAAAARLALSSRASSAFVAAGPQLGKLFRAVVQHVIVDYADASCIALRAGAELEVMAVAHRDADAAAQIRESLRAQPLRMGEGLLSEVVHSGTPLLFSEVNPERLRRSVTAAHAAWIERYMPSSLVIVPLRMAGEVIGALAAMRHDPAPQFSRDDQHLLEEIAGRAAMAIGAARLHEANEQGRVRAELLYELAAEVIRAKTVDDVFGAALAGIERALGASRCSILTFDAEGVMRFRAWRGLSDSYRAAVEGHSPWPRSEQSPEPIVVPDVLAEASLSSYAELFQSERIGALGFIPLVSEGRLIGKFMVYYPLPRALSAAELDMAKAIANHVAAAIGRFAALRELEQTVHFNEIFTGMLGHELRNPLGAIMAAAQMAARRCDQGQLDKPLARIINSGERMATMIDQLLDFTRVRVGAGIPIDPRASDLCAIMGQAVDELSHAHPTWRFSIQRAGDTTGVWDTDRILQVLSNLVGNAVQHGSVEHGVSVIFDGSSPDVVSVRIHNMGTIPAELLPRLFEPMAGGDRRRTNSRGLGLGLYISREILRAHGGDVQVASSAAEGTSFTLRLPRVAPGAEGAGP
jgi:PAS domain S-box-containing protein